MYCYYYDDKLRGEANAPYTHTLIPVVSSLNPTGYTAGQVLLFSYCVLHFIHLRRPRHRPPSFHPLKLICPPRMRIPWILFLYHHLHHSSIQHHLHLPLLHYNNTWSILCGGCKCLSTMHSVSYYMVYYYKIVRRTGLRDSCGSCGAGSAFCSSSTLCPPFPIYHCYDSAGALSLCRNVFAIGEGAFYSVGKKKIRTVPSASTASMSGSLSNSLIFVPSHPPNQVHVECLSLCLSAASVVVAVLLSEHIILSLAFWSAVPTMIHLFCVVQCAHQYSIAVSSLYEWSSHVVAYTQSSRTTNEQQPPPSPPPRLLLHRDYNNINVLYLWYVMLLLLTGVWLCARVTLYADRRGAAQYSSCIVSANQPASQAFILLPSLCSFITKTM